MVQNFLFPLSDLLTGIVVWDTFADGSTWQSSAVESSALKFMLLNDDSNE
jgi:hypothetical protein